MEFCSDDGMFIFSPRTKLPNLLLSEWTMLAGVQNDSNFFLKLYALSLVETQSMSGRELGAFLSFLPWATSHLFSGSTANEKRMCLPCSTDIQYNTSKKSQRRRVRKTNQTPYGQKRSDLEATFSASLGLGSVCQVKDTKEAPSC